MKKYIAIGHWKEQDNVSSVVCESDSIKAFRKELVSNGFVQYVILSEDKFNSMLDIIDDGMALFYKLKGISRNTNTVVEYIQQCYDIIQYKLCLNGGDIE